MKTIHMAVLTVSMVFLVAGCGSPSPDQVIDVTVSYLTPQTGLESQSFHLTDKELKEFKNLCPDLNKTKGPGCKSVYPFFTFAVRYGNGKTIETQFCCGELRTFHPNGNLDAPKGLYEFLTKAIESRAGNLGWMKARDPSEN